MASSSSEDIPSIIHAISGSTGGILSMLLTYPLITLSTHAQTKNQEETTLKTRVSMRETLQKILAGEGLKGLYSGLESAVIGIGLTNFVYYYFYEFTKKLILKNRKVNLSTVQSMLIGCIAGCITVISTNPIWVANTRLTVARKEHKDMSTLQIILMILKEKNGLRQLFNGVLPALVLVANPIIQYSFFEQVKNLIASRRRKISATDAFFIGALGKLLATGLTYPYITLKLRMHLHKDDDKKSMGEMIKSIFENEGIIGFYNGISVKLTQSILTAAFLFYFKEELVTINYKAYKLLNAKKNY